MRYFLVPLAALVAALGCARGSIPILPGQAILPSTLTAAAAVTRTPIYLFTPGPGFQFSRRFGIPRRPSPFDRWPGFGEMSDAQYDQRA
jgi:hypothetical protein